MDPPSIIQLKAVLIFSYIHIQWKYSYVGPVHGCAVILSFYHFFYQGVHGHSALLNCAALRNYFSAQILNTMYTIVARFSSAEYI